MRLLLADRSHDAALRKLMRESSMPGRIRLAFAREPDFFHGLDVLGKRNQSVIATDRHGVIQGMGCRSIRPVFVHGEPTNLGYLSGLRIAPESRHGSILARGYAFLRELHADGAAPAYLTTIVAGNRPVEDLLTSGRAGLPAYLPFGRFVTCAICRGQRKRRRTSTSSFRVQRATDFHVDDLMQFLRTEGRGRQFFPVLAASDLGSPYLRGLQHDNFYVATAQGRLLGAVAVWDQSDFKQTVVTGYSTGLGIIRPLLSRLMTAAGFHPLPPPGAALRTRYLSFVRVVRDDPAILSALLEAIYADQPGSVEFLVLGFHERDPLQACVRQFLAIRYASTLYLACWEDGLDFVRSLDDGRIPYLDPATL